MRVEKIKLKEKSPEYAEEAARPSGATAKCEMDGCSAHATHKAPKDRSLNAYYNFCLDHVTAYNAAWDYFDGLSMAETEYVFKETLYGERPTRKMYTGDDFLANLRAKAFEFMEFSSFASKTESAQSRSSYADLPLPENHPATEALRLFDLPLSARPETIKTRYKELVKKWHPDLNGGSKEAEEKLKHINMAYTLLKVRFEA